MLEADRAALFVVDRVQGALWSKIAEGAQRGTIRVPLSARSIAGAVALSGDAVCVRDAHADPRFDPSVDRKERTRTRGLLAARFFSIRKVFRYRAAAAMMPLCFCAATDSSWRSLKKVFH